MDDVFTIICPRCGGFIEQLHRDDLYRIPTETEEASQEIVAKQPCRPCREEEAAEDRD